MSDEKRFEAAIEAGSGGGTFVVIPFDVEETYGTRGRVKIQATIDGVAYRGSIAPMGGRHLLGVVKPIRLEIGKGVGDTVSIVLRQDLEERTVAVPEELAAALAENPDAARFFESLAYTYRKEYAQWIAGAKRPETRARRLETALEKLTRGDRLS